MHFVTNSNQINWMFIRQMALKYLDSAGNKDIFAEYIPVILLAVAIPDIKNFFHKVLAEVFAKFQYLYSRRKLLANSIEFSMPVTHSMYVEVTIIMIFSAYKLPMNKNAKVLCLYCTDL